MLNVSIVTIPHQQQRYPTVGDWIVDVEKSSHTIFVSDMGNWKYELCVAVHELIELFYCLNSGITQQEVDEWDIKYELQRKPNDRTSEPGDDPKAPYHTQHKFATFIERGLALVLGVNWDLYEQTIENLF